MGLEDEMQLKGKKETSLAHIYIHTDIQTYIHAYIQKSKGTLIEYLGFINYRNEFEYSQPKGNMHNSHFYEEI